MTTRKVNVGLAASGIAVLVAWGLKTFWKVEFPAEAAMALQGLVTFAVQWAVPNAVEPDFEEPK